MDLANGKSFEYRVHPYKGFIFLYIRYKGIHISSSFLHHHITLYSADISTKCAFERDGE